MIKKSYKRLLEISDDYQQVTMPDRNGRLHLGTWEQIHYAEFDGRRKKRILVKVVGVL